MILVDFSAIAFGAMHVQPNKRNLDAGLVRHMILNSLRMYNVKYRAKYGEMIICCDGGSWRKEAFVHYKAKRKVSRESSANDVDWDGFFAIMNAVKEEIRDELPFKIINVLGAEGDDIIGAMTHFTQEFGRTEDVMIISADHDFIQLQRYGNVKQFSPSTGKLVTDKDPIWFLFDHILRGDTGDGVPNVLSADDVFVTGTRQTPLSKKKKEEWWQAKKSSRDLELVMGKDIYKNFIRNEKMIDLTKTPKDLCEKIVECWEQQPVTPKSKTLPYLIRNRLSQLIGCAADFFPPPNVGV